MFKRIIQFDIIHRIYTTPIEDIAFCLLMFQNGKRNKQSMIHSINGVHLSMAIFVNWSILLYE